MTSRHVGSSDFGLVPGFFLPLDVGRVLGETLWSSARAPFKLFDVPSESETSHSNSLRFSSFCWEEIRRALDRLSVPVATIERGAAEHLTDGGEKRTFEF